MAGVGFMLFEIFVNESGQVAKGVELNECVSSAFNTSRFIVTVVWSIYPLGYFFIFLLDAVDDNVLNLTYNLADMLYKIVFVAVEKRRGALLLHA